MTQQHEEMDRVVTYPAPPVPWTLDEAAQHPATVHARAMMAALGIGVDDEATAKTPARFIKALLELTSGARLDPDRHFAVTFPAPSEDPGMVLVPGIPFVSICEHHLLTFTGTATVAYLPTGRIVGLSKIARVVQEYAARPQVQERLGDQVVAAINKNLSTLGAACVLRAVHSCMTLRGAKAVGAAMVTSHLTGLFREDPAARSEFIELTRTGSLPARKSGGGLTLARPGLYRCPLLIAAHNLVVRLARVPLRCPAAPPAPRAVSA